MQTGYYYVLFFLFLIKYSSTLQAQGVIINEASNGASGTQEFVELLVIGSSAIPTGKVNLSGWILDDNNGDFEGSQTGVGIATGHIRIAPGCLTSVSPGALIVIYNAPDRSFTPDETDSNGDCVYFFPDNSPCLEECSNSPNSSNAVYPSACTYGTANWNTVTMRNGGDAIQVRDPSANFFHGFSYGDVTIPAAPLFPASLGGGTAFSIAGSGSGHEFIYNDGDFTNSANFTRQPVANETVGAPNNDNNRFVINKIRDGTFDYANLAASGNRGTASSLNNCSILLPLKLLHFSTQKKEEYNILDWEIVGQLEFDCSFEVEQSKDGVLFTKIQTIEGKNTQLVYQTKLLPSWAMTYYRLKILLKNGLVFYSPVQVVARSEGKKHSMIIAPNPVKNVLQVELKEALLGGGILMVYDMLGRLVLEKEWGQRVKRMELELSLLEQGTYQLLLKGKQQTWGRKFIK